MASTMNQRTGTLRSTTYPYPAARASNDISERMPLQASTTSRLHAGQNQHVALAHDGEEVQDLERPGGELRGDELQREDDLVVDHTGIGMANSRNAMGKAMARSIFDPAKYTIRPQMQPTNDKRARDSSAPRLPMNSTAEREQHDDHSPGGRRAGNLAELVAPGPDQIRRQHRNQKPVGVVGIVVPLPDQQLEDGRVQQNQRRRKQQPLPAKWL